MSFHNSWKANSACMRVLTNTSVVLWARIAAYTSCMACTVVWPAIGRAAAVSSIADMRPGAAFGDDEVGSAGACVEIAAERFRLAHRGREADRREPRRQPIEPRQIERQEIAALRCDHRMQLVDDDSLQAAEQGGGFAVRQQQRQLFRRRQQNVGRPLDLALTAVRSGVSPVRASTLTGSAISETGASRLRAMSTASALSGEM